MPEAGSDPVARASLVYCSGELLDAVQRARIFSDSKHFVDMPLRTEPEEALAAFAALPTESRSDPSALRAFVYAYFEEPGTELVPYQPDEFPGEPPLLGVVADEKLREFLRALHELWPTLVRVIAPRVLEAPQRFSALPRRSPVVLPGGRFRETYYWDSFWIVEGLIASGMVETARGLVQNLLDDVSSYGFVPNGGRVYYLNRSQPPLLCDMVASVARALGPDDLEAWLPPALEALQKEHAWWMDVSANCSHVVEAAAGLKLNRYCADWSKPRPESYREDIHTADGDPRIYREIATAAETGWDFSARWARGCGANDEFHLEKMETTMVAPIDLNAILYRYESTLALLLEASATSTPLAKVEAVVAVATEARSGAADFAWISDAARRFAAAAAERKAAIRALMWQGDVGRWTDFWTHAADGGEALCPPMLSDFAAPLWAGLFEPEDGDKVVQALRDSGLLGPGGAATTVVKSGEQWDFPNAWPPLQAMLIEGLRRLPHSSGGPALAAELAQRWVGNCYVAWRETGYMHEKYDATVFGSSGKGGEYEPQVGFGWSNGVVLQLLRDYGRSLSAPADAEAEDTIVTA